MYCNNCGKEITPDATFCSSCGNSLTGKFVKEKTFDFSQLSALTIIYVIIISILAVIGSPLASIIGIIIGYFLSVYAINHMTYKINGSVNWAFAIIMSFGIIGYACYWIYFLTQRNKQCNT